MYNIYFNLSYKGWLGAVQISCDAILAISWSPTPCDTENFPLPHPSIILSCSNTRLGLIQDQVQDWSIHQDQVQDQDLAQG